MEEGKDPAAARGRNTWWTTKKRGGKLLTRGKGRKKNLNTSGKKAYDHEGIHLTGGEYNVLALYA